MIDPKNILKLVARYERHTRALEKEYKKKNIEHRLREDFGYAYTTGKIAILKYILKEL